MHDDPEKRCEHCGGFAKVCLAEGAHSKVTPLDKHFAKLEADAEKPGLDVEIVKTEKGAVVVNFSQPVGFLEMEPQNAADLGLLLITTAGAKLDFNMPDETIAQIVDSVLVEVPIVGPHSRERAIEKLKKGLQRAN